MDTTEQNQAALDLWSEYAPMVATLEFDQCADFLATAPTGTVVEIYDELFSRLPSGDWRHLEELVFAGNSYSEYREHDSSTPEQLFQARCSEQAVVRLLRLGHGPSY